MTKSWIMTFERKSLSCYCYERIAKEIIELKLSQN